MGACIRFFVLAAGLAVVSCREKPAEAEISETRPLTSKDERPPKLFATSEERFEGGRPVAQEPGGAIPAGWRRVDGSAMRLLNFAVGPNGEAEVYLTKSRGDVAANVARWLRQFGVTDLPPGKPGSLPPLNLGKYRGVLVEAEGTYSPGMGRPDKKGQALVGVIASAEGVIWTLKMTGPKEIVASQREIFLNFSQSLDLPE